MPGVVLSKFLCIISKVATCFLILHEVSVSSSVTHPGLKEYSTNKIISSKVYEIYDFPYLLRMWPPYP